MELNAQIWRDIAEIADDEALATPRYVTTLTTSLKASTLLRRPKMPKCSLSARMIVLIMPEGVAALHPRLLKPVAFSDKSNIGKNWYIIPFVF